MGWGAIWGGGHSGAGMRGWGRGLFMGWWHCQGWIKWGGGGWLGGHCGVWDGGGWDEDWLGLIVGVGGTG